MKHLPVQTGASLSLAFRPHLDTSTQSRKTVIVVGGSRLASVRCRSCLEAGYKVICLPSNEPLDPELAHRSDCGEIRIFRSVPDLGTWLEAQPDIYDDVALVVVTDTVIKESLTRSEGSTRKIRRDCLRLRIPVNIADRPDLSDFAFPVCHRFPLSTDDGRSSPLQISITTNSSSCRLATRLKRMIVSSLPKEVGSAVERVGRLRELVRSLTKSESEVEDGNIDESWLPTVSINRPVQQLIRTKCASARRSLPDTPPTTPPLRVEPDQGLSTLTRMRFVAQICGSIRPCRVIPGSPSVSAEFWPIKKLADLTDDEAREILGLAFSAPSDERVQPCDDGAPPYGYLAHSHHELDLASAVCPKPVRTGKIFLLGSGPGSPGLLTVSSRDLLTRRATLILSDKLVPSSILDLVPSHIPLVIAKKFPGNSEGAQTELMALGLEALKRGETVVRLKQGDPLVFGRGGEEVLFFRSHGYEPVVVPGISSALAGPLMAGVPVTQRGVAESVVVCTGVGRQGRDVTLPGYVRSRCLVILMGVARLRNVVESLTTGKGLDGPTYPKYLPIAIVERASSPDQRVVSSTLGSIVEAFEEVEVRSGGQRPPGMMVVGWSVMCLVDRGDVEVLSEGEGEDGDRARVEKWLGGRTFTETEGLPTGWEE